MSEWTLKRGRYAGVDGPVLLVVMDGVGLGPDDAGNAFARARTIRPGDRVVVKTRGGEVMAKLLARKTARTVELDSLNPDYERRTLATGDIDWIARIIWASQ